MWLETIEAHCIPRFTTIPKKYVEKKRFEVQMLDIFGLNQITFVLIMREQLGRMLRDFKTNLNLTQV